METNASLKTEKEFTVPVQSVYEAWTNEEQLKQWWKPMRMQLAEVVNELHEGGKIEYKFQGENKNNLTVKGEYLEVRPNEKLVCTWNWQLHDERLNDSKYKLTVLFKSSGAGSSIEISQENDADQELLKPHEAGWDEELNNLADYLNSKSKSQTQGDAAGTAMDHEGKPDYGSQNPAGS